MKKIIFGIVFSVFALALVVVPSFAAKPSATCKTIQDGVLSYAIGHYLEDDLLSTGYDAFGYNYQAHIFNGSYANAYLGRPGSGLEPYIGDDVTYLTANPSASSHWAWQFRNVQLQMKWNDAWLANKDCNNDGVLDRSTPYKGSGAWLTNHATGTYTSATLFDWNVAKSWVINVEYLGTNYPEDLVLTQSGASITGSSLELVGGGSPWTIDTGLINVNSIDFEGYFNSNPTMRVHFTGTIASDGSMSGNWYDVAPGTRIGTWATTSGLAEKTYRACTVSDFVKIIAPPSNAVLIGDTWFTADGKEIGKEIWGEFAIIQEIASDPCGEYGVINYLSPFRKGLGNWSK